MAVQEGKFYAQYQPLHTLLLALGHLGSAPWLINPLCAALTVCTTYALGKRIFGTTTGIIASIFLVCSQFVLFMSCEYMNHASTLLFTALFMLTFVNTMLATTYKKRCWLGLACGACFGAVLLIRPLTGMGLGFPFAIHAILQLKRNPQRYGQPFIAAFSTLLISMLFMCWYNNQLTGNPFQFPSSEYHNGQWTSALGFDDKHPFTVTYALTKAQGEWARMNFKVFEWPTPCLILLLLYVIRPAKNPYAQLLLLSIISHTLLNMANQFTNLAFGPRYMYETMTAICILSAAGLTRLPILLSALPKAPQHAELRAIATMSCILLFASAFTERLPVNIDHYGNHYGDNDPAFYQSMLSQARTPALIFVGRNAAVARVNFTVDSLPYRKVAFTYPPDNEDEVIFAYDQGDSENQKLIHYFTQRLVYVEEKGELTEIPLLEREK